MKRHLNQCSFYKGHLIGTVLQFQRFSPLSSWQEAQHVQADLVLEDLTVLHLHPKKARCRLTVFQAARRRISKTTPTVIQFLLQDCTYFNKVTPPNSHTPLAKHIQTTTAHIVDMTKWMSRTEAELRPMRDWQMIFHMDQGWKIKAFIRFKYKYLWMICHWIQKLATTASSTQMFASWDWSPIDIFYLDKLINSPPLCWI